MFSKRFLIRVSCLTMGMVLIASCVGKMGEDPPQPTAQKFSGAQCLSTAKPVVKAFFKGDAQDREVAETWDCVTSVLESFKRYVRGSSAESYTPQEVATFLEDNFMDMKTGEKVSVEFQAELMKVKQLLVGGSATFITFDELTKAKAVIQDLRQITVSINPYMKVVTQNWKPTGKISFQDSLKFFEEANLELQNAAKAMALVIERNGSRYELSDFVLLMNQMASFVDQGWTAQEVISKYMPVAKKIKKAIAGGDENSVEPKEWRRFALLGARGYVQYLRYYYFIANASSSGNANRLGYIARTVEDIFSVFADLVGEKPEGVVTRGEVTELLNTLSTVWPAFRSSPALVLQVMKIKQVIFGGSVESWNSADFLNARSKVDRLKALVEKFLPYSAIYGLDWDPQSLGYQQSRQFFNDSQVAFTAIAKDASLLLESSYDLRDLERLLTELKTLYPGQSGSSDFAGVIKKYLPLITDTKNIFVGGTDATISKAQWTPILGHASRIYMDYLYYRYYLQGKSWDKADVFTDLSYLVNQSLDILKELLGGKQAKAVSRAEVLVLMKHLSKLDVLPAMLKPESLDKVINLAVNNILVPYDQRLAGKKPNALTVSSIEVARQEVQIWLDSEKYFLQIRQHMGPSEGVIARDLVTLMTGVHGDAKASTALRTAAGEFLRIFDSPVTMAVDKEGRLMISAEHFQSYDGNSLKKANINRLIARLLIRSFAMDGERIKNYAGITLSELQAGMSDLMPLLIELGMVDPDNKTFAASRFRESNIFTPHADGNNLASLTEISDIVGMIFSGINLNGKLSGTLYKDCFRDPNNVPRNALVKIDCAKNSYVKTMPAAFVSMPGYLKYMTVASKDEWSTYMTNIFKAAGYIQNSRQEAKLSDISLAPHVVQYIEMIFLKYDQDRNGIIDTKESLVAFPSFRGILLELAAENIQDGSLKEKDLDSLFTYILRFGKPPESFWEKWRFAANWRGKPEVWDVAAGRSMLAQILGYIADQVSKNVRVMDLRDLPTEDEVKARKDQPPQHRPIDSTDNDLYRN